MIVSTDLLMVYFILWISCVSVSVFVYDSGILYPVRFIHQAEKSSICSVAVGGI